MIRGIHHVAIHVRDLDRMIRFYRDAFGFNPISDDFTWADSPQIDEIVGLPNSSARNVMLRAGNCYIELFQYLAPPPGSSQPLNPQDHGYTHFCVDVTDAPAEVERLAKLGMTFDRPHGPGQAVDVGFVKAIYGRDPEGNIIEIQETSEDCLFDHHNLPKADFSGGAL
jgi:catechol 2,3-dioxygenase-like lactoylglutathione lyase family enzyme